MDGTSRCWGPLPLSGVAGESIGGPNWQHRCLAGLWRLVPPARAYAHLWTVPFPTPDVGERPHPARFLCFLAGSGDWDPARGSLHTDATILGAVSDFAGSETGARSDSMRSALSLMSSSFFATLIANMGFSQTFQATLMGVADQHGLSTAITSLEAQGPEYAPSLG